MEKKDPSYLPIVISLESKDYAPKDSDWQRECHHLYLKIKNSLDEGIVEPLKVEEKEKGRRGGLIEIYNMITAGIASIGGLTVIIELVKLWLEHKKGSAEITLKFPDGSEIKVSGASKEDILNLYQKQLAK